MKTTRLITTIVFSLLTAIPAFGGGAACQLSADGLPLLKKSPVLMDILTSKFLVMDGGKMGPEDAPFDDGRKYTYMEFRASSVLKKNQKFLVRIHFTKKNRVEKTFEKIEFLPVKHSPKKK